MKRITTYVVATILALAMTLVGQASAQADDVVGNSCTVVLTRQGTISCSFTPLGLTGVLGLLFAPGTATASVGCTPVGNTSRSSNGAHTYSHIGTCTLVLTYNPGGENGVGFASATAT